MFLSEALTLDDVCLQGLGVQITPHLAQAQIERVVNPRKDFSSPQEVMRVLETEGLWTKGGCKTARVESEFGSTLGSRIGRILHELTVCGGMMARFAELKPGPVRSVNTRLNHGSNEGLMNNTVSS